MAEKEITELEWAEMGINIKNAGEFKKSTLQAIGKENVVPLINLWYDPDHGVCLSVGSWHESASNDQVAMVLQGINRAVEMITEGRTPDK